MKRHETRTELRNETTKNKKMNDTTLPKQEGGDPTKYPRRRGNKGNGGVVRPGFGLHDWMTLLRRAKDLAQRKGSPIRRDISPEEVRLHDKPHDGWCSLRGKVYNISPYLSYHPGGDDILLSVLGRDATALFDKYHRWINIDNLIGPLLLGTLVVAKRGKSSFEYDEDGEEDGEDDEDEHAPVVPSASASASSHDIVRHSSHEMPMTRPNKDENSASLLPPRYNDDETDEADEYPTKI